MTIQGVTFNYHSKGVIMADSGLKKYLIKSKVGFGRDFHVFDDDEGTNKVYFIDGKAGLGTHADIKDANDKVIYTAKGKIINVPRRMEFSTPDGSVVATLSAHISLLKSKMTLELTNGKKWFFEGDLKFKHYQVKEDDKIIINIDQKWLTIRDKYFVEIANDTDVALALGIVWALDVWREGNNN